MNPKEMRMQVLRENGLSFLTASTSQIDTGMAALAPAIREATP